MNKEEIIDKIAKMENEIFNLKKELNKQQEEPKRRWKPEIKEAYYCITGDGDIILAYWIDSACDRCRYKLRNVFKTYEEAKFALEKLKVLAELQEYADCDKEWIRDNTHWNIGYETNNGRIEAHSYCCTKITPFNLYFSSEEQAQKAIDAIGEERLKKYYFCVTEE